MKFDFRNILIGIIIGILSTIIVGCLVNDVYIDIRIGDNLNKEAFDDLLIDWKSYFNLDFFLFSDNFNSIYS